MSNSIWALVLVGALLALSVFGWYRHRAIFFVIALHNGVWAGGIALVGTSLVAFKEATTEAWLTLLAGLIFFNVGCWVSRWPRRFMKRFDQKKLPMSGRSLAPLVSRTSLLVLSVIYAVAFIYYLITVQLRFGILALVLDADLVRGAPGLSYLEAVPLPVRLLLYIGPLLFVILGYRDAVVRPMPLWVRLVAMGGLSLSMLALLQRTNLFLAILWLATILVSGTVSKIDVESDESKPRESARGLSLVRQPVKPLARIAIALGLLVAIGGVAFFGVGTLLGKNGQQAIATGAVSRTLQDSGLTEPFVYYTAGIPAFLQLTESTNSSYPPVGKPESTANRVGDFNPQTWGLVTFSPLMKLIPGVSPWPGIVPFIDVGIYTNVFTWLEPFYRDFRVAGVAFGTLALGYVMAFGYRWRMVSPRIFWIQAAFVSTIMLCTFALKINTTQMIMQALFVIALTVDWRIFLGRISARWSRRRGAV